MFKTQIFPCTLLEVFPSLYPHLGYLAQNFITWSIVSMPLWLLKVGALTPYRKLSTHSYSKTLPMHCSVLLYFFPSFSVCVAFKEIYCQFIIFKFLIFYHEDIRTKVTICFFHFLSWSFALPSTFLLNMQ